ncbi:MAG: LON peptidase substrate-binding domain-containing protein [Kiloniellaceae bacterium]
MTRTAFDPNFSELPQTLPIFPLPGVLLLPGGRLPLNVFEPRYLAMVRDAISGERMIGLIQPRENGPEAGSAKVYGTGCAGRITAFSETDDGRYLVTLFGLIRFDVERELPPIDGYRRVLADYRRFQADLEDAAGEIDRARLLDTLGTYFDAAGIEGDWDAIEQTDDERLVTSLAMICPFAASEKQALLEAMTLPERVETMTALMEMALHDAHDDTPRH